MSNNWTFLTNHAHILICLAGDPTLRLRDLADRVGITERAAARIVTDLTEAGYLEHRREGRRSVYALHLELPLRHPLQWNQPVSELIECVGTAQHRPQAGETKEDVA
jgi:DNA-binding Lrp family transcriptional regulator